MEGHGHPIDRGYSWVTVCGASVGMFFVIGGFKSMGILFVEVLNTFEASQGLTAVMMGVISAGMSVFSPFMTAIGIRFTMRAVVMCGGLLMALAALLCSVAPNIYYVIFVFGLITGAANACIFAPSLVVVGEYFDKRRSIANGLAMAGASIGQLIIPLLVTFLFKEFHFQGALIIYSAFCLHVVLGGALLRPSSFYKRKTGKQELTQEDPTLTSAQPNSPSGHKSVVSNWMKSNPSLYNSTGSLNLTAYQSMGSMDTLDRLDRIESPTSSGHQDVSNVKIDPESKKKSSCVCCARCVPFGNDGSKEARKCQGIKYDTSVFRNYLFIIYLTGIAFGNSGYADMVLFIPAHVKDCGYPKETAALLLSICGVTDFFGRIVGGWFADLGLVKRCNQMGVGLIIVGIFGLVCTFFRSLASLVVLSVALGLVGGIYVSLMPVVLVDFIGPEKFPSAFGLTIMVMGMFNLGLPGIFGKIRDVTGSYTIPYCVCSCLMFIGGSAFLLEPIFRKLQEKKDKSKEVIEMEVNC